MKITCLRGMSLNTIVYRGYAKASHIASISDADIFDQIQNPEGTQRDLKLRHAREAHAYANGNITRPTEYRFWPEILLNVRDKTVIKIKKMQNNLYEIEILTDKIREKTGKMPQISRVDGNHRLYYAEGFIDKERDVNIPEVNKEIPFSITIGLSKEEESAIFADINNKALKMNTSHLEHLRYRLTDAELIKREDLALWIAEDMYTDEDSPFYKNIYLGGKKPKKYIFTLKSFKDGINTLLKEGRDLNDEMVDYALKSKLIKHYWWAIKNTYLEEWNDALARKRTTLLLSYFAYFAWSKLGAFIIDRSLRARNPSIDFMQNQLIQIKSEIDWTRKGIFRGYGGKGGGDIAFEKLKSLLPRDWEIEEIMDRIYG